MIVCPSCKHEELVGALYCSECGAELFQLDISPPETAVYESRSAQGKPGAQPTPANKVETIQGISTAQVVLKVLETGQTIPLEGSDEFTLGRISGNQPILPDLDLTTFKAYDGGVSRLHATIKITEHEVQITDLGSANGTRVNGKKITAHQACTLSDEDILSLGRFKLQIFINQ
jgi:pSer/pThr/pTyr-binding forkhead associated (FHA) protein